MEHNHSDKVLDRVRGFRWAAVASGLKKGKALDMCLIFSDREAVCGGVFTTNKVKAAPILLSMENVRDGKARAIVANAGNANACTGPKGLEDARSTARMVADQLNIRPEEVLVASTGVIGMPLDMDKVAQAIPRLAESLSARDLEGVAKAIMTTDSFPKLSGLRGEAGGKQYFISAVAKGAGMIMPNMATMLCFVLTDVQIQHQDMMSALRKSVSRTFNRITVDGDTSTNDCVLMLANGAAGNDTLSSQELEDFQGNLEAVMRELALAIVKDGEGATRLVEVVVKGAQTQIEALKAARSIANSLLVKTAIYGKDPNWGRIMAALGRAEVTMDPSRVDIWIGPVQIVSGGMGTGIQQEEKATEVMHEREFALTVDIHQGGFQESVWTCDLTHDYVSINADYRT